MPYAQAFGRGFFLIAKARAEDRELVSFAANILYCRRATAPAIAYDFVNRRLPERLHAGAAARALEFSTADYGDRSINKLPAA